MTANRFAPTIDDNGFPVRCLPNVIRSLFSQTAELFHRKPRLVVSRVNLDQDSPRRSSPKTSRRTLFVKFPGLGFLVDHGAGRRVGVVDGPSQAARDANHFILLAEGAARHGRPHISGRPCASA